MPLLKKDDDGKELIVTFLVEGQSMDGIYYKDYINPIVKVKDDQPVQDEVNSAYQDRTLQDEFNVTGIVNTEVDEHTNSSSQAIIQPNYNVEQGLTRCDVKTDFSQNQRNSISSFSFNNKKNPTAYDIAQEFICQIPVVTVNNSIYCFTGMFYQKTPTAEIKRLIISRCRDLIKAAGSSRILDDVLSFIMHEPSLNNNAATVSEQHVSFLDVVLDLYTNAVTKHTPLIFTDYCLQCEYAIESTGTPCFDNFLQNITSGDIGIQARIWEMIGYILSPDTNGKCFFVLQGCPNSGKSVLSALIRSFFNDEAVSSLDVHALSEKFAPSELEGKRVCVSPDLPLGVMDSKSVSKLKQFTGNDVISADVKYQQHTQFQCRTKFVLATNHPLLTRERDDAFYERIVAIPFEYAVPKEHQIPNLLELLKGERSGIAIKALAAYYNLRQNSYRFSGNYEINTTGAILQHQSYATGVDTCMYKFVSGNFVQDVAGGVFTSDAYELYIHTYGEIPLLTFSRFFTSYAEQLFGASKTRKRKTSGDNATSYVAGIAMKQLLM